VEYSSCSYCGKISAHRVIMSSLRFKLNNIRAARTTKVFLKRNNLPERD
jgi:hypothetical protein